MSWLFVGAAVVAVGAISAGEQANNAAQAQANADEYNATLARQKAEEENRMAGLREDDQRRRARVAIGKQLASSAQAGAGLNSDLLRQSIYDSEMDTALIRYEGASAAAGLNSSAMLSSYNADIRRQQGHDSVTGSLFTAAGSLLNAGSKYYNRK